MSRRIIGRYIVSDDRICDGAPTFRGTHVPVADVLARIAQGTHWETIIKEQQGQITREAIREALALSAAAFMEHLDDYVVETVDSQAYHQ